MKTKIGQLIGMAVVLSCAGSVATQASASPGPAERTDFLYVSFDSSGPDYRLFFGDGDWRPGFAKTECGPVTSNPQTSFPVMVGLSGYTESDGPLVIRLSQLVSYTPGLLCGTSNVINVDYNHGQSVWFGQGSDHRLDTSTGDWAYGYDKGECGNNEVMTGIAVQAQGINEFRCSPATTALLGAPVVASNCEAVDFDEHDGFDPYPGSHRSDWFPQLDKGNCGANRYIKGFSVNRTTYYKANKILCCGPQLTPSGNLCNANEQCVTGVCGAIFGTLGYCQ